jgi:hypothetical protein
MNEADLKKAIEIAEESTCGFADDGSFEHLLAMAVLELRDRLNNEREACAEICDGFYLTWIDIQGRYEFMGEGASECAGAIRARGQK